MVDYSQEDGAGACLEPHTFSVGDAWKDTSFPHSPALCSPEQILPQPPRFTSFLISPCPPLYPSHFRYGCRAAAPVLVGQPWLLLKIKQWPAEQQTGRGCCRAHMPAPPWRLPPWYPAGQRWALVLWFFRFPSD